MFATQTHMRDEHLAFWKIKKHLILKSEFLSLLTSLHANPPSLLTCFFPIRVFHSWFVPWQLCEVKRVRSMNGTSPFHFMQHCFPLWHHLSSLLSLTLLWPLTGLLSFEVGYFFCVRSAVFLLVNPDRKRQNLKYLKLQIEHQSFAQSVRRIKFLKLYDILIKCYLYITKVTQPHFKIRDLTSTSCFVFTSLHTLYICFVVVVLSVGFIHFLIFLQVL